MIFARLLLFAASSAFAHAFPMDQVELIVHADRLEGTLAVHAGQVPEGTADAQALLDRGLVVKADSRKLDLVVDRVERLEDETHRLHFTAAWETPPHLIGVRCRLFPESQYEMALVVVRRASDPPSSPGILSEEEPEKTFTVAVYDTRFEAFRAFLLQGIRHIFIGPDHIAFILGLILLGGSLLRLATIVTGFTIAHSLTLALAVLGIFAPSPKIIEPLIALSIVVIGIENLRPAHPDRRAHIAFGFGFIHGFAFAEVLRDFGLPRAVLGVSLFSFNLGVEVAQLSIVAAALPALALLRRRGFKVERLSWGIVAAGAWWLVKRLA